jgi:hypothetical protein
LPAYQITCSSEAKNSPFVEVDLIKNLAWSIVNGGSIDGYKNFLSKKRSDFYLAANLYEYLSSISFKVCCLLSCVSKSNFHLEELIRKLTWGCYHYKRYIICSDIIISDKCLLLQFDDDNSNTKCKI